MRRRGCDIRPAHVFDAPVVLTTSRAAAAREAGNGELALQLFRKVVAARDADVRETLEEAFERVLADDGTMVDAGEGERVAVASSSLPVAFLKEIRHGRTPDVLVVLGDACW